MSGYGIPQAILMALIAMAVLDTYAHDGEYVAKLQDGNKAAFSALIITVLLLWGGFFS